MTAMLLRGLLLLAALLASCHTSTIPDLKVKETTQKEEMKGKDLSRHLTSTVPMPLWTNITTPREDCPRFIVSNLVDEGLGDMLSRLLAGIAVSKHLGATLVFYKEFWKFSNHQESGYGQIFETELGIPFMKVMLLHQVINKYNPTVYKTPLQPDAALFSSPDTLSKFPCNSLFYLSYSCFGPGDWCGWYISSALQTAVRPFLDECRAAIPEYSITSPLRNDLINVVWHIRTGDVCLHCTNATQYENVHKFIMQSVGPELAEKVQNIVVHHPDQRVEALFKNIPNTTHYSSNEVHMAVRLFRQADILVTTGSSFPNSVSLFTSLHRPVVIQSLDKDAETDKTGGRGRDPKLVREKYFLAEDRAIRLDMDWNVMGYRPEDLKFILLSNGVLARVSDIYKTWQWGRPPARRRT